MANVHNFVFVCKTMNSKNQLTNVLRNIFCEFDSSVGNCHTLWIFPAHNTLASDITNAVKFWSRKGVVAIWQYVFSLLILKASKQIVLST